MLYPFTAESYTTPIRSIAFSLNSAIGRIGATIMPFVIYPAFESYENSPFLILAVFSLVGLFAISATFTDTYNRALDDCSLQQIDEKPLEEMPQNNYQRQIINQSIT